MATPKKENMIRTMVYLKPEHVAQLQRLQTELGVKPAESIRRALDLYFSKPTKRGRR